MSVTFLRHVSSGFLVILIFAMWCAGYLPTAMAQTDGAGVGITPAVIEEGAVPGTSQEHIVTVTNLSAEEKQYFVYVRDIVGVKQDNSPLYADEGAEPTGFELSQWVSLDVSEITIPSQGSVQVKVTITVPPEASPGSHFGALFVSHEPPRLRSTGAAVGYDVANIISIRVAGDANEKAEIRQFSTDRFVYGSTDIGFTLRIENLGNVLVRPVGPLEIRNMFGEQVALLTFNESQGSVFPGATREFSFRWQDDGIGFGRYEARVSPIYGGEGSKNTISSTVSFWILPMNIIGPAAGVLLLLLALVYLGTRLYVRRTVAVYQAAGERRIVRTTRRRGNPALLITFVAMSAATVLFLIILLMLFA
jgi:hypothetical protein